VDHKQRIRVDGKLGGTWRFDTQHTDRVRQDCSVKIGVSASVRHL
jgi:hypothetical protein